MKAYIQFCILWLPLSVTKAASIDIRFASKSDKNPESLNVSVRIQKGTFIPFQTKEGQPEIWFDNFKLKLLDAEERRATKWVSLAGKIEVEFKGTHFATLSAEIYQRLDKQVDLSDPKRKDWVRSRIVITSKTPGISKFLYDKYENQTGKGYGWILPKEFLSPSPDACKVVLLDQNYVNKELLRFGGFSQRTFKLDHCSSVDYRILSVVKNWLIVNFLEKSPQ